APPPSATRPAFCGGRAPPPPPPPPPPPRDPPRGGAFQGAGGFLLRQRGPPLRRLEGAHRGPDQRDRGHYGAGTKRVRRPAGGHGIHRCGPEPLCARELPPVPGPVLEDVAPPHRIPHAGLRRVHGVLRVLQERLPRDH